MDKPLKTYRCWADGSYLTTFIAQASTRKEAIKQFADYLGCEVSSYLHATIQK